MRTILSAVVAVSVLGACGGGGGGSDATSGTAGPVITYPLQAAFKARVQSSSSDNFTVSGTCSGSATSSVATPLPSTFEGTTGYASAQTWTFSFTNCTPATGASTTTSYYDSNYLPLGNVTIGTSYERLTSPAPALPTSVSVGDTAAYATLTVYADSTKSTVTGSRSLSYVIEADTASGSVVANLITKAYNTSNQLLFTQQSRYRLSTAGTLTVLSIDVQYSTTSTNHLVYTKS